MILEWRWPDRKREGVFFFLQSAARGGVVAQRGVMGNDRRTKRVMGREGGTMNQAPPNLHSPHHQAAGVAGEFDPSFSRRHAAAAADKWQGLKI